MSGNADILSAMRAYHLAMIDASVGELESMLDDGYSLVHITGYVQPRNEWLDVIRTGQFDYHAINIDEASLSVNVSGSAATVSGRGIFNATINGMKNPWRLQFTLKLGQRDGRWILMQARYTTFNQARYSQRVPRQANKVIGTVLTRTGPSGGSPQYLASDSTPADTVNIPATTVACIVRTSGPNASATKNSRVTTVPSIPAIR